MLSKYTFTAPRRHAYLALHSFIAKRGLREMEKGGLKKQDTG